MGEPLVWSSLEGQRPRGPWLWSRAVDTAVVGSGASLAFAAVAVVASAVSWRTGDWLIIAFMHLGIAVNYPHYAATYHLIVRERHLKRRSFHILLASLPVVALLAVLGAVYEHTWLVLLLRVYLTWSPYHYAKQHFGIACMYAGRNRTPLAQTEKRLLVAAFVLQAAFMMIVINASTLDPSAGGSGVLLLEAILPSWTYGVAVACSVVGLGLFAEVCRRHRARTGAWPMRTVLLLFLVNLVWLVVPNVWLPGQAGPWVGPRIAVWVPVAVPFFHCVQYLAVSGHRERLSGPVRPIVLMAGLMVLGYTMFEVTAQGLHHGLGLPLPHALFLMSSLINVHHFWLDGIVWRSPRPAQKPAQPSAAERGLVGSPR
ncbi:hypothetical protein SAMN04487968_11088 [Nocardioides terrae]|uniref:Uncharacterized protein n=1 Tax=Nocardioides terrae TaxID=574651 RepID=A0A1I1LJL6_9ACTN|nr:hypothetical protein [Nocardioides terrae]SFC73146.1 hypothetical protein SAMN04487968_11088 [Nocardioides terrae]